MSADVIRLPTACVEPPPRHPIRRGRPPAGTVSLAAVRRARQSRPSAQLPAPPPVLTQAERVESLLHAAFSCLDVARRELGLPPIPGGAA